MRIGYFDLGMPSLWVGGYRMSFEWNRGRLWSRSWVGSDLSRLWS